MSAFHVGNPVCTFPGPRDQNENKPHSHLRNLERLPQYTVVREFYDKSVQWCKGNADLGHTGCEEGLKDDLPKKWNLRVETGKIGEECVSKDFEQLDI